MATQEAPDFDDLEEAPTPSKFDDSNAEFHEFDEGEAVVGEIRKFLPDAGDHDSGTLELIRGPGDSVWFFTNETIKTALDANDLGVGDVVGVKKSDEPRGEFENDDGETQTAYDWEVRQL